MPDSPPADPSLAQRLLDGDRRALARAITLVEDDRPEGWELVREVYPHTGNAAVVGFTGPPGVGKSTLIGAVTKARREAGRSVGVLSIDPSSPFTHGALLGDRIRLSEHFLDEGVFIRSMANRGALGGLSLAGADPAPAGAPERWSVPIVKTEAGSGEGVAELVQRLSEHRAHISAAGQLAERRRRNLRSEVLAIATARMRRRLEEELL